MKSCHVQFRKNALFSSVLQKWSQNISCKKYDGGCRKFGNFEHVLCYLLKAALVICLIGRKQKKWRRKNFVWCFLLLENIRKQKWNYFFLVCRKRTEKKENVWCFLLVEENKKRNKKTRIVWCFSLVHAAWFRWCPASPTSASNSSRWEDSH